MEDSCPVTVSVLCIANTRSRAMTLRTLKCEMTLKQVVQMVKTVYPTYSHRLGLALHLRYQDPVDHSLVFFGVSAMVYYCTAPQSTEHLDLAFHWLWNLVVNQTMNSKCQHVLGSSAIHVSAAHSSVGLTLD